MNSYKPLNSIVKEDLVAFFKDFKGSESSRQLYAVITKTYFTSIKKPEIVDWLKAKKPRETLRSDEILTASDVNAMIDATDSMYWKCLLALMYETGGRIDSELLQLKYSDFLQTDKGIVITITTKKTDAGFRKMLIPLSENYFINLKDSVSHKPEDKVFNLKSYRQTYEVIMEIGRRAKITKPFHPHAFRHARATEEVRKGTQEAIIRKMLGWSPTSTTIARYQQLNDEDIINSQSKGENAKRTELKVMEKVDVTPLYEALKEENQKIKEKMDKMESLLKRWLDNDHIKDGETEQLLKKYQKETS